MSSTVVPPIGFANESGVVIAEEHLVLVVQRERRTVGGTGIDKLDIGVALRTPRLGTRLDARHRCAWREPDAVCVHVVQDLVRSPGMSVGGGTIQVRA